MAKRKPSGIMTPCPICGSTSYEAGQRTRVNKFRDNITAILVFIDTKAKQEKFADITIRRYSKDCLCCNDRIQPRHEKATLIASTNVYASKVLDIIVKASVRPKVKRKTTPKTDEELAAIAKRKRLAKKAKANKRAEKNKAKRAAKTP